MDRFTTAVHRLWGSVGSNGELHSAPKFADELAEQCNAPLDLRVPRVSKWSFGQQLEHLYHSSHYVLDRLEDAMSGRDPQGLMGPWGYSLMVFGFIPRKMFPTIPQLVPGAGTLAEIQPLEERLHARLEKFPWTLGEIRAAEGKSRHPRMKYLTARQWMFFADIHHRHHLRILRDIRRFAGVPVPRSEPVRP